MDKEKKIEKEGVYTVTKGDELIAIVRRDPISKKHLVYLVTECTSDDLVDIIAK